MIISIRNLFFIFGMISISFIECYRILGVFPYNAKSHNVMFNAIMKGLTKQGHQVDHITHYPLKNAPSNYKVVVNLNGTLKHIMNSFTVEVANSLRNVGIKWVAHIFGNDVCKLLALDKMQKFLKELPNNPPYDVVLTEAMVAHCYMGIGHLLKVPVIAISSSAEYPWISQFIGNYDNLAVIPNILLSSFDRNNFWDRLNNVITYHWNLQVFNSVTESAQTQYMRKYINPDIPNIREVEKNVALTIVNRHPVLYGPKAVTSSLIEASGLHIEENDDVLDETLKKWLDESKHGVVYFTFGSLVLIESLPVPTIKELFTFFAKLAPMRVLMKIADKSKLPPGLPKNVFTLPWMPQQPILAHKNVHVFLTHGGLMGCQEALYYGVPMIGIPLFADQGRNIAAFVDKNMAVALDLNNITNVSLTQAFNKLLHNPHYRKNAKFYSKIFKDRPLPSMDTTIFWIEYIIRNGPEALRSPGLEMPWWQIALIDVYGFIFLSLLTSLALIYYAIKIFFKNLSNLVLKNMTTKSKVA